MKLKYNEKYKTFYCECTFMEKDIPDNAGFKWSVNRKVWFTTDVDIASNLLQYGTEEVFKKIDELRQNDLNAVEESLATDSDINIPKPDGLEYRPFQKAGIEYGLKRDNVLFADEMGLGKSQPLDSKVLTPTGWIKMGDIKIGDKVIDESGNSCKVLEISKQGLRSIYRVTFSDGSFTECDREHLWQVTTTTRKFRKSNDLILTVDELINSGLQLKNGNSKYYIPIVNSVKFKSTKNLPINPYVLGCILGGGGISQNVINFTCAEYATIKRIRKYLPNTIKLKRLSKQSYRFVGNGKYYNKYNEFINILKNLKLMHKLSYDKFIPDTYKINSIDVRLQILRGILDTDGYVSKDNTLQYYTSSKKFARDVKFIAQSLGATVRNNSKIGKINGKEYRKCYILTLAFPNNIIPVSSKKHLNRYTNRSKYQPSRGIISIDYIGKKEAQCILVDNKSHLYITDDFIVTHNTIQAIGVINGNDLIKKVLITCPATMKLVWKSELEKWIVNSDLEISVWNTKEQPDGDIIIVNYDIIKKLPQLTKIKFDIIIGDEIHYCKSNKAQRSKAFYKLAKKACKRVYLTGTPILNKPAELFYILKSLNFPMNWKDFMVKYAKGFIDKNGYWNIKGASNLDDLQDKLRGHVMVRRLKKDVLRELPDKVRQVIELPDDKLRSVVSKEEKYLKEKQETIKGIKNKIKEAKEDGDEEDYKKAVKELKDFNFTSFQDLSRLRHLTALKKVPYAVEHIKEILESKDKVVVFAHHLDVLDELYKSFEDKAVLLKGETSQEERKEIIDHFQTDPNCKVFISSIKAGGVGITLTASSTVIFVELDWTPANISQAEDRCHRIGQKDSVLVQHLVINGSIDSKVAKMCVRKQEIITEALDKQINISDLEE